ncbi:probable ubiquitin-like-specific protease 2A isoform X2 [Pistacia vera]|uniref:probable ubiquitin-like-specific protease 2A isoform X2 n=1 Tax=Pistacia vera TaxID=55513 RepID=UPI0012637636|nr:probable ubiquitin-like-specific protease 2A isoform X2 [Pistacia vera]
MKKKKYQVFDFDEEDERVEKISKKLLGKFSPKNRHTSPVNKYKFLQCFSKGSYNQQKEIRCETTGINAGAAQSANSEQMEISNEPIVVDDGVAQKEKTHQKEITEKLLDVGVSSMDNHCTYSVSYPKGNPRKDCTLREAVGLDTSLFSCSSDYENEQVSVISDDDDCIEMSSSISSSPPSDNEDEWVAEQGFCGHETDLVKKKVIVFPDFILYREMYCTMSRITFSCSSIKVEGSTVNGTNGTLSFECNVGDIIKIQSAWHGRVETAIINLMLKSNDSIGAEKANEISGIQLLKFAVYDPHWFKRQEAIKLLDVRYEEVWDVAFDCDRENEVNTFLGQKNKLSKQYLFEFNECFEDVIYPKGDPDAVVISRRDVELLQPETFINDTIIDFYIQYLKKKLQPEERHRFHFFNSFFFRKLAGLDKDPSSACEGKAAFQRVRKWTKNVNLYEKDYVFIPVNYSLHWSLIVICHPGEVAYFKDDEIEKSTKVPCILHMDSIKGSHRGLKDLVQSYLSEEWKEKHNNTSDDVPSKFLQLRFVSLELPQQENSFDCGLFLLHYAELFIAEAPSNFNPFKITGFSNFLNRNWFSPMEASSKRAHIKALIYELCEDHSNKDPSSTLSPDEDGLETEAVVIGQTSTPTKICQQGYSSTSNVGKGIETPIVGALLQRVAEGPSDSGLVSREHCQQITACYPKSIMSPIEEGEETSDERAKSSSDVEHCQKVTGLAAESSTSYICRERVSQKTSCDWQCLLHFEEQDESISEYQNISKENIDENQLVEEYKVPNHQEMTSVKPEGSPTCSGKFATSIVEDSEEENNGLVNLVIEDSQEELLVEDSQEEIGLAALVVEDYWEVNCSQNACKNKDTGSSFNSGICTLTYQEADLTEIVHIKEDKTLINDEDPVSERDEQQVAKKLRLEASDDREEHMKNGLPKAVLSLGRGK